MKKFLPLVVAAALSGCGTMVPKHAEYAVLNNHKKKRVRVTYYTGRREKVSSTGHRAVEGRTIATARKYKYGTIIHIPELREYVGEFFRVEDRGPAVEARTASHKTVDVIDVFVTSKRKMNYLSKILPEYLDAFEF